MSKPTIIVVLEGGVVQNVVYPEDCPARLEIREFDEGEELAKNGSEQEKAGLGYDDNGEPFYPIRYGF